MKWTDLIAKIAIDEERSSDVDDILSENNEGLVDSDDLATFKL